MEEKMERKTAYWREEEDIVSCIKKEEVGWEGQSEEMKREDGVRDEIRAVWREQEEEEREQRMRAESPQTGDIDRVLKNGGKLDCVKQEEEGMSHCVTSYVFKQPRLLNHLIEMTDIGVFSPSEPVASNGDQVVNSPWRQDMVSPMKEEWSLRQKGKVMTWKRKMTGNFESPLKQLSDSSEKEVYAEPSFGSPVITPRKGSTGQAGEVKPPVFACSQCPFVHTDEVNLHQHFEKAQSQVFLLIWTAAKCVHHLGCVLTWGEKVGSSHAGGCWGFGGALV
ncbi:hypothetical protein ANANG_G00091090 [Anguilla anguilla]|uniref:Uncharacterized protein n=1 Tax=Anguilla anguilla TaxID=7936 RepID=A0A9D3MLU0_ANGAN|nr:hypothetical protein ANANG_G00091090 [Anguilla anguilla]